VKIASLGARAAEVPAQTTGPGRDGNKLLFGMITKKKQGVSRACRQLARIPDN